MMHFVRTVLIIRVLKATKAYCYKEVRNYGKVLFIQNIVENGWWGGMHTQHTPHPPGFAPGFIITKDGLKFKRDALN